MMTLILMLVGCSSHANTEESNSSDGNSMETAINLSKVTKDNGGIWNCDITSACDDPTTKTYYKYWLKTNGKTFEIENCNDYNVDIVLTAQDGKGSDALVEDDSSVETTIKAGEKYVWDTSKEEFAYWFGCGGGKNVKADDTIKLKFIAK